MLARQRRFEALFHQLLARPAHRGEAGFQRLHDLAVAPSVTRAGRIGLQTGYAPSSKAARSACRCGSIHAEMSALSPVSFTTYFFTLISLAATNRLR